MEPMTKDEAEQFLAAHPKPWGEALGHEYGDWVPWIGYGGIPIREMDLGDLLRYVAYLEQDNARMRREHEPDYYCNYCNKAMLEDDNEFIDSRDTVHCSQECVDKAEEQR